MRRSAIAKIIVGSILTFVLTVLLVVLLGIQGFSDVINSVVFPRISCNGLSNVLNYSDCEKYAVGDTDYNDLAVNELDIEWFSGSVLITESTDGALHVYETGNVDSDSAALRCILKDGELIVKFSKSGYFIPAGTSKFLTVEFPAGTSLQSLKINSGAGNVTVNGISSEEAEINFGAGNVDINCPTLANAEINMGAGDVKIAADKLVAVEINMGAGNVDVTARNADVKKIEVNAASGDLKISVPADMPGFNAEISAIAGTVNAEDFGVSGSRHVSYGNGQAEFEYNCAGGKMEVSKIPEAQ